MEDTQHQTREPLLPTSPGKAAFSSKRIVTYTCIVALVLVLAYAGTHKHDSRADGGERSFAIQNNRFMLDGKPLQIISGRCAAACTTMCCCVVRSYLPGRLRCSTDRAEAPNCCIPARYRARGQALRPRSSWHWVPVTVLQLRPSPCNKLR